MAKQKIKEDISTEARIKEAARKLFTENGFVAVRTRDIAAEAGINLALLNYYFRSKENLFEIIMNENLEKFVQQMIPILSNADISLEAIMEQVVSNYIDMLKANPDLPFFILNEMRGDSPKHNAFRERVSEAREKFKKRIEHTILKRNLTPIDIGHFINNFMGLIIFPFIAKPIVMRATGFNKKEFDELMDERKKLIPVWVIAIMKANEYLAKDKPARKKKLNTI